MSFILLTKSLTKPKIRNRLAFTMIELMLAIGIFAVGMSLVAGLFPAAIKEAESTVKDYEGPIICENGLAIAKARLTNTNANAPLGSNLLQLISSEVPSAIVISDTDRISRKYDTDDDNSDDRQRGFTVLAKQWAGGRNDYQLVIVAYDIKIVNNINVIQLTGIGGIPDGDTQFTYTGDKTGLIGSPLIDPDCGRYATIIGIDGNTIHLDHSIGEPVASGDNPLVIIEENSSGTPQDTAPVLGVLVTRTALRD